eukprot:1159402-Pelagomonas_calceolata.AAC.16
MQFLQGRSGPQPPMLFIAHPCAQYIDAHPHACPQPPLLIIAPEECHMHYTAPDPIVRGAASNPPPENVGRLHVLTRPGL